MAAITVYPSFSLGRKILGLNPLSFAGAQSGVSMFGLDRASIVYLVEQLKGRSRLKNYKFWFAHAPKANDDEGDLEENQSGEETRVVFVVVIFVVVLMEVDIQYYSDKCVRNM